MKELLLTRENASKINTALEFRSSDVEGSIKGLQLGELVKVVNKKSKQSKLAYFDRKWPDGQELLQVIDRELGDIKIYIKDQLIKSYEYRTKFSELGSYFRLAYGQGDSLPGLIIDRYDSFVVLETTREVMRIHVNLIKETLAELISGVQIVDKNDLNEVHESDVLRIKEHDISFEMPINQMQKLGHYYDHRANRERFKNLLNKNIIKVENGLDVFCYTGSWGLSLLSAGVKNVTFVDQADLSGIVDNNLKINGFENRGEFVRADAFEYLKNNIGKKKFNVIVSDPPAFAKSPKMKNQAIRGYEKIHENLMDLLESDSLLAIGSCTHYVSFDELGDTVVKAAQKKGRKVKLIDIGLQDVDHPFRNINDEQFYIKYLAYYVE